MSEWAARLGLLFPEKAKIDLELFVDETLKDGNHFLFEKDYDEDEQIKPSYEQISQERILDEASKNIQILKSFETILQERTQSYSTFFAAQGKYKQSFEIFQYCEGTLRQALDALFVFLEQELQQARQQQTLGDLRKALSEVKLNAQKRLLDYQREVTIADKDVATAEKKLLKSKSFSEKSHDYKVSNRVDMTLQERLREFSESVTSTDKDIKESVQCLLKALSARDQVLLASRRAHQRLDKDCKKAVAVTFRKFIVRERESAIARETVLAKLESAVNNIDVDGDLDDFIIQHRQGDEGSLHCCAHALKVLEDLLPLEEPSLLDSHTHAQSHAQPASNTKPSINRDRKESQPIHIPSSPIARLHEMDALPKLNQNPSSKSSGSIKLETRAPTQPLSVSASQLLHPIETENSCSRGESSASVTRIVEGKEIDLLNTDDYELSKDRIVQHLSRIFYCQLSPKSVENILSSSSSPRHGTFFRDGTSPGNRNASSRYGLSYTYTDCSSPTYKTLILKEQAASNHIAYNTNSNSNSSSSSSGGSSSSDTIRGSIPEELRHPLSIVHSNYITLEDTSSLKKDGHASRVRSPGNSNQDNDTPTNNNHTRNHRSDVPVDNILGTNIADDFYSSNGSVSGQTLGPSPGFCIKTGFSDDDSIDNLSLSAQFLSDVVKTQEGRNAFIVELNQFRSKKVELGEGFGVLGNVLWDALDRCKEDNDVRSAKIIMMLSQTFYRRLVSTKAMLQLNSSVDSVSTLESSSAPDMVYSMRTKKEAERKVGDVGDVGVRVVVVAVAIAEAEPEDQAGLAESDDVGDDDRLADRGASSREYLKAPLMAHDLWKDRHFWEQALWQCAVEQLHTIPYERAWHDLTEEHRMVPVRLVHSVIFSQAMAITHSMIELGCSKLQTKEFLLRMCALHELSERQRQDLLAHLMSR